MTHGVPAAKKGGQDGDDESDEIIPPPDGGWGWAVVFASFMIHVVADGLTYTLGIFIPEWKLYYGEGSEATSWVPSILVAITLGTGPIVGALVNKYGCRIITIAGAVVAFIGLAVSMFAPSIELLYVTIGLVGGFGLGLIYLPAIVCVTCYFEKKRSFATGIAVCGSGLGTFVFAPIVSELVTGYTWKGAILILSAATLNCIIFGALFRPLEMRRKRITDESLAVEMAEMDKLVPINEELQPSTQVVTGQDSAATTAEFRRSVHGVPTDGAMIAQENLKNNLLSVAAMDPTSRMVRSQPHLLQVPDTLHHRPYGSHGNIIAKSTHHHVIRRRPSGQHGHTSGTASRKGSIASGAGVMYRKDVLYSGSMCNIPEYRANPKAFAGSMLRMAPQDDIHSEKGSTIAGGGKVTVLGCIPCDRNSYDALAEMMDFSIFKDPIFIMFALSNFCTSIGFNVPYVYIVDKALDMDIPRHNADFLLSVIGIANTIGRIILGYVADKPWMNRLYLYIGSLTACGVATALSAFCNDYGSLIAYGSVFGATIGAYVGLTSVVLVDLLGLDKLTNAFGFVLLFQGIASLIGPPIAGRLKDSLNSYDPGFYVAGTMIAISGLMLIFIPCMQRCLGRTNATDPPAKSDTNNKDNQTAVHA